jgi:hypothetical protein
MAAFLVTAVAALTLGILGLACSTAFHRTLPATVSAYGAGFVLFAGTLLYGLLFPTEVDATATQAPAPPAVTYLSPLLPLITIGTNQPVTYYGVRNMPYGVMSGGSSGACSAAPGGPTTCVPSVPAKGTLYRNPPQPTGTAIPSGLFAGWQYWQASVVLELLLGVCALALSAVLMPPIRRLPWRRRAPTPVGA